MGAAIKAAALRFLTAAGITLASLLFVAASALPAQASATDNVTGWVWSGSIGWVSMNCSNTATCATSNFGVTLSETPGFGDRADLSGYAWSENVGWVCFGMTCTGTTPEGGSGYAQFRVTNPLASPSYTGNDKLNQIWGWAKIVSMGDDGWIQLNCDRDVGTDQCPHVLASDPAPVTSYYLRLNIATGALFTPHPSTLPDVDIGHWAWGSNSMGTGAGWVDFSGVTTTWTLANLGTITRPEGVYEPPTAQPGTHRSTLTINFAGFSGVVGQLLECEIGLPDFSRRVVNKQLTSSVIAGSQSLTYTITAADSLAFNNLWYLEACRIGSSTLGATCGNPICTGGGACSQTTGKCVGGTANGSNCGDTLCSGGFCDENVNKCRTKIQDSLQRKPIYTHANIWTGLGASQDQYSAVKCNTGFPGAYFKNAAQCDFTGDASFSLMMRRGIPIEGDCGDGIDNDGNGQADCNGIPGPPALPADRNCKGISYRCQTLERTTCKYNTTGDGINDCSSGAYASGDLCCTQQPVSPGANTNTVVDGLECTYRDAKDGYFDCDCKAANYNGTSCYAPGYSAGDLCCSTSSVVQRVAQ